MPLTMELMTPATAPGIETIADRTELKPFCKNGTTVFVRTFQMLLNKLVNVLVIDVMKGFSADCMPPSNVAICPGSPANAPTISFLMKTS